MSMCLLPRTCYNTRIGVSQVATNRRFLLVDMGNLCSSIGEAEKKAAKKPKLPPSPATATTEMTASAMAKPASPAAAATATAMAESGGVETGEVAIQGAAQEQQGGYTPSLRYSTSSDDDTTIAYAAALGVGGMMSSIGWY
ncbi:hypothetical protein ACP70R_035428 [Stipagrostis hirtigluma subsp. patula]